MSSHDPNLKTISLEMDSSEELCGRLGKDFMTSKYLLVKS